VPTGPEEGAPSAPRPPSNWQSSAGSVLLFAVEIAIMVGIFVFIIRPGAPQASATPSLPPASGAVVSPTASPSATPPSAQSEVVLDRSADAARRRITEVTGYDWTEAPLKVGTPRWVTDSEALSSAYPCIFEFVGQSPVEQATVVLSWDGGDPTAARACVGALVDISAAYWGIWSRDVITNRQAATAAGEDWFEVETIKGLHVEAEYTAASGLLRMSAGKR
jgi:hypothetical protein